MNLFSILLRYALPASSTTAVATQKAALAMTAPGSPDPTTLLTTVSNSCPPAAKMPREASCWAAKACTDEFEADKATAARMAAPTAKLPTRYLSTVRACWTECRVLEHTLQLAVCDWKRSSKASLPSLGPAACNQVTTGHLTCHLSITRGRPVFMASTGAKHLMMHCTTYERASKQSQSAGWQLAHHDNTQHCVFQLHLSFLQKH